MSGLEKNSTNSSEEAKKLLANTDPDKENESGIGPDEDGSEPEKPVALGTVKTEFDRKQEMKEEAKKAASQMGYRNIDPATLPSKGRFNRPDMKIKVRPLTTHEIVKYSELDEGDFLDINEHLIGVLSKAVRIYYSDGEGFYGDLKEADKFFMLFVVRDVTMDAMQREKHLTLPAKCTGCGKDHKRNIDSNMFGYYEIPKGIDKFYNSERRCFVVRHENFDELAIHIPSVGVLEAISDYIIKKEKAKRSGQNVYYDKHFMDKLQFLVNDVSDITDEKIDKLKREYINWHPDKRFALEYATEKIEISIKPTVEIKCAKTEGGCGDSFTTPIRFPAGYRSLFDFSNIATDLFGDH